MLLRLYSPVCVGPGQNPNCWFSHAQAPICLYSGHLYWSAEDDSVFNAGWNTYRALMLPDWDKDGVPEILIANGGDPTKEPEVFIPLNLN